MVACPWCRTKTHPPDVYDCWHECKICGATYTLCSPPVDLEDERIEFAGSHQLPADAVEILVGTDYHPAANLEETFSLIWMKLKVSKVAVH